MNTRIEQLRREISQSINNSELPVGVVYYLIKDLMTEIGYLYEQSIQKEAPSSTETEE